MKLTFGKGEASGKRDWKILSESESLLQQAVPEARVPCHYRDLSALRFTQVQIAFYAIILASSFLAFYMSYCYYYF